MLCGRAKEAASSHIKMTRTDRRKQEKERDVTLLVIVHQRWDAITVIVNVETYTQAVWTKGTRKHNVSPKGQFSSNRRATLKGILKAVMRLSEQARLAISMLVVVLILGLPKATLHTSKLPHNDTATIRK